MKRKFLSVLLAASMVLTALPATAWAEEELPETPAVVQTEGELPEETSPDTKAEGEQGNENPDGNEETGEGSTEEKPEEGGTVEKAELPDPVPAPLHDTRLDDSTVGAIADDKLYESGSYKVTPTMENDVTTVAIAVEGLKEHRNNADPKILGYWVGFSLAAPENATSVSYYFGATRPDESTKLTDLGELEQNVDGEGGEGIAFYVNADDKNAKTWVKVQWTNAEKTEIGVMTYQMDLTGVKTFVEEEGKVTLPAPVATVLHDASGGIADKDLYNADSYKVTAEEAGTDGVIPVKIAVEGLKQHFNGANVKGLWVGYALTPPEGATQVKYAMADSKEALDAASMKTLPTLEDNVDGKGAKGIAFYANKSAEAPKVFAKVQWLDKDGKEVGAETSYKMDLTGVTEAAGADLDVGEIEVKDNTASTTITGEYKGSSSENANDEVSTEGNEIVFNLVSGKDGAVNETVKTANVTLEAETATSLADQKKDVSIKTDVASVKLNATAMNKVAEGTTVTITVSAKAEEVPSSEANITGLFDISIKANGKDLLPSSSANENGNITITMPATDEDKAVYYVSVKDSKVTHLEKMDATKTGDTWTFTTTHLSDYATDKRENVATIANLKIVKSGFVKDVSKIKNLENNEKLPEAQVPEELKDSWSAMGDRKDWQNQTMWVQFNIPPADGQAFWAEITAPDGTTYGIVCSGNGTSNVFAWSFLNDGQFEAWPKDESGKKIPLGAAVGEYKTEVSYFPDYDSNNAPASKPDTLEPIGEGTADITVKAADTAADAAKLPKIDAFRFLADAERAIVESVPDASPNTMWVTFDPVMQPGQYWLDIIDPSGTGHILAGTNIDVDFSDGKSWDKLAWSFDNKVQWTGAIASGKYTAKLYSYAGDPSTGPNDVPEDKMLISTADITLSKLTLDANGGNLANSKSDVYAAAGDAIEDIWDKPTHDDSKKVFGGWKNSEGKIVKIVPDTDIELKAYWTEGKTAAPVISPNGGAFKGQQTVTITCATEGADIYYTTDGTEPTVDGTKYTGALTITPPATVKAMAVKDGMAESDTVTAVFTKKPSGGGGSSSGGGGGGGASSSSSTITISSDSNSVKADVKISGGTATIGEVDKLNKVIGDGVVAIDLSKEKKDIDTVKVDSSIVNAIANNEDSEGLEIKLSDGTVTLDADAVAAVKGGDLTIKLDKANDLNSKQKDAVKDMDVHANYVLTVNGTKALKGGKVDVRIPFAVPSDKDADGFSLYFVAEDGTTEMVSARFSGDEVRFTADAFGDYVIAYKAAAPAEPAEETPVAADCDGGSNCPAHKFTDVNTSLWYHKAVDYAINNSLMSGVGENTFSPNANLSRAMLAQILYNLAGRPAAAGASDFNDVAEGMWYTNAIAWAAENGVVSGLGNGKFGPNDNITREQLAVMLYRYAGSPAAGGSLDGFADAGKVSGYAQNGLVWATSNGVMSGKGGGMLDPQGLATRAEVAQMLYNYLNK